VDGRFAVPILRQCQEPFNPVFTTNADNCGSKAAMVRAVTNASVHAENATYIDEKRLNEKIGSGHPHCLRQPITVASI
jgi:hypothetical protein